MEHLTGHPCFCKVRRLEGNIRSLTTEYWCIEVAALELSIKVHFREFDPGSERTLAARLTHASRTRSRRKTVVKWQTGE